MRKKRDKKKIATYSISVGILILSLSIVAFETTFLRSPAEFNPGYPRIATQIQDADIDSQEMSNVIKADVLLVHRRVSAEELQTVEENNPDIAIIGREQMLCGIAQPDHYEWYPLCDPEEYPDFYARNYYVCEIYEWVVENDAWLYREDGEIFVGCCDNKNWLPMLSEFSPTDAQGRRFSYFFSDLINDDFFVNVYDDPRVEHYDAWYLDCATPAYWYTEAYNDNIKPDLNRDGIGDQKEEFNAWWEEEGEIFFSRLRNYADENNKGIIINGQVLWTEYANGFQLEHLLGRKLSYFNNDREKQWQYSMFDETLYYPGLRGYIPASDYFEDNPFKLGMATIGWKCGDHYEPSACCNGQECGAGGEPTQEDLIEYNSFKRFGLGSVLLGDGYISFDHNTVGQGQWSHNQVWWMPEYDNGGQQKHYLGQDLNSCKMINENGGLEDCEWKDADTDFIGVYTREFENGVVFVNPTHEERKAYLDQEYKILDVIEHFGDYEGGQIISEDVTIPPFDAIILLNPEEEPPENGGSPIIMKEEEGGSPVLMKEEDGGSPVLMKEPGYDGDCNELWNCTEWGPCAEEGITKRECHDINKCGTTINKPPTKENCDYIEQLFRHRVDPAIFLIGILILAAIGIGGLEFFHKILKR